MTSFNPINGCNCSSVDNFDWKIYCGAYCTKGKFSGSCYCYLKTNEECEKELGKVIRLEELNERTENPMVRLLHHIHLCSDNNSTQPFLNFDVYSPEYDNNSFTATFYDYNPKNFSFPKSLMRNYKEVPNSLTTHQQQGYTAPSIIDESIAPAQNDIRQPGYVLLPVLFIVFCLIGFVGFFFYKKFRKIRTEDARKKKKRTERTNSESIEMQLESINEEDAENKRRSD